MYDLIVKNGKLVTPDRIYEADIAIKNGIYSAFLEKGTEAEAKEVIDAKGNYVFPGIIDCHAHLNEPGFEYREDFETGSRAAAAAGCTCPNGDLFPTVNMGNVRKALEILKPYGALCGFHCEEYGQVLEREREAKGKEGRTKEEKIRDFLDAHDVWTEYVATKNVIDMARATGGRVHIRHVSHPMVAQAVKDAIYEGLPVTAETCPHYLGFTEDFVFEKGAPAKCTPPMRKREDMEKLWDYVLDGTLSCVGSDHSPAADEEKDNETKDIWHAWGGLNSIQFFLPMMFDMVVHKKGLSPSLIAKVMDYNPAKVFGLYGKKGAFELGFDGDIVIVDPDKAWTCRQEELLTKGHVTCFDGLEGKGAPVYTIIRGKVVAKDGMYEQDAIGYGKYVKPVKR